MPRGSGLARERHCPCAVQILRRQRVLRLEQLRRRAHEANLAAVLAGPRADVDDQVGRQHHLRVVFHHQQRVSGIAQAVQDVDHAAHVPGVQPDAGLVQHEQGVHQRRAQRSRQIDALHLAATERAGLPVEGQIAQAHFQQVVQACANLGQQQPGGLIQCTALAPGGVCQTPEEVSAVLQRQRHHLMQRQCLLLRAFPGMQMPPLTLRFEPRALAGATLGIGPVFGEQHADVHLVGLGLQPAKEAVHPIPVTVLRAAVAFQHPGLLSRTQVLPGHIQGDLLLARVPHQIVLTLLETGRLPRADGTLGQGLAAVRNDQSVVHADHTAKPPARFAGADG